MGLVLALAFSPDGKFIASGGSDATVRLWELDDKHLLSTWTAHSDSVYALAFSIDGDILASGGRDPEIRLWNVKARGLMSTIPAQEDFVWKLAFWGSNQDDKQHLVSVNRNGWSGNLLQVVDLMLRCVYGNWMTNTLLSTWTAHSDSVSANALQSLVAYRTARHQ